MTCWRTTLDCEGLDSNVEVDLDKCWVVLVGEISRVKAGCDVETAKNNRENDFLCIVAEKVKHGDY